MTDRNEWTGRVGNIWAREWRRTDRSFADLSTKLDCVIRTAAPPGAFRALDIGSGAGATSLALADARPDAAIIGIDISEALVDVARRRAADLDGTMTFLAGDAPVLAGDHGPFDLLYSRHGVMFFADPVAAFAALHGAAAPGARLIFSCFRDWRENGFYRDLAIAIGAPPPDPIAPGPFAFAARDRVASILETAGWRDVDAEAVDFDYRAGQGVDAVDDAVGFLSHIGPAARQLAETAPEARPAVIDRIRAVMTSHLRDDAVDFPAAAWIWSARA